MLISYILWSKPWISSLQFSSFALESIEFLPFIIKEGNYSSNQSIGCTCQWLDTCSRTWNVRLLFCCQIKRCLFIEKWFKRCERRSKTGVNYETNETQFCNENCRLFFVKPNLVKQILIKFPFGTVWRKIFIVADNLWSMERDNQVPNQFFLPTFGTNELKLSFNQEIVD